MTLNVVKKFKVDQLEIDYLDEIFFDTLEIFLEAVFLLIMPDLATCIRIDWNFEKNFFALSFSFNLIRFSIVLTALLYLLLLILLT